jgi:hypothetical protein
MGGWRRVVLILEIVLDENGLTQAEWKNFFAGKGARL